MPVNADIPDPDVHYLDRPAPVVSELGARSLGELPSVGVAAAVGDAVHNATGIRVRDLPTTLDKLLGCPLDTPVRNDTHARTGQGTTEAPR
ncbi:hypothetical protein [Streptomyces sp. NPDC002588]|uniref:hypothetical protein n=1 Tax=Streptomyces sp. NPDC002588 TaxID=3154419 RepID=UPI003324A7BB